MYPLIQQGSFRSSNLGLKPIIKPFQLVSCQAISKHQLSLVSSVHSCQDKLWDSLHHFMVSFQIWDSIWLRDNHRHFPTMSMDSH